MAALDRLEIQCFIHMNRMHLKRWSDNTIEFRHLTLENALKNNFALEAEGKEPLCFSTATEIVQAGWVMD